MTDARCPLFAFCGEPPGHAGNCVLAPQPGMQEAFASTSADIAIAGGAAGPGKTAWLMIEALRHIEVPGFSALILRKSLTDIEQPGGLWDKSKALYSRFGGEPKIKEFKWVFPSGATIQFGYVNSKTYEQDWQGAEVAYLAFDELTHFTKSEFVYLLSRNRTTCGIRAYCRATCNPDADSWVRQLVDHWIDPEGYPRPERAGRLRYYVGRGGRWEWADTPEELLRKHPRTKRATIQSVTFIPGRLSENRFLGEDYEGRLLGQEEHIQARLLGDEEKGGNWNVRGEAGKKFKREWLAGKLVDGVPPGAVDVRSWDLASTPARETRPTEPHTAGIRLAKYEEKMPDGTVTKRDFYVRHARIGQWDSGDAMQQVLAMAREDGPEVPIWFCKERAGAGKAQFQHYVRALAGYEIDGEPETGDKPTRLDPVAAQAKAGNFYVVRDTPDDRWNEEFFRHLFRLGVTSGGQSVKPDDVGDALAAAFDRLTLGGELYSADDMRQAMQEDQHHMEEIDDAFDFSGAGRVGAW